MQTLRVGVMTQERGRFKVKEQAKGNKSNWTMIRPLWYFILLECVYLGCDSFPDEFGRFGRFLMSLTELVTDGHTDGHTDVWTDRPSYRDVRTHLKIAINSRFRLSNERLGKKEKRENREIVLKRKWFITKYSCFRSRQDSHPS